MTDTIESLRARLAEVERERDAIIADFSRELDEARKEITDRVMEWARKSGCVYCGEVFDTLGPEGECEARRALYADHTKVCAKHPMRLIEAERDHLSSENASLARQVDSMAMRIESLAEELAKPEDVRLSEVLDALDGRFPIFDSVASRVSAALDEAEEFIGRAGEAERMVEAARRSLSSVAESMTEHAYQELASALESPPRIAGKTAGFDQPGREHTAGDALGLRRDR